MTGMPHQMMTPAMGLPPMGMGGMPLPQSVYGMQSMMPGMLGAPPMGMGGMVANPMMMANPMNPMMMPQMVNPMGMGMGMGVGGDPQALLAMQAMQMQQQQNEINQLQEKMQRLQTQQEKGTSVPDQPTQPLPNTSPSSDVLSAEAEKPEPTKKPKKKAAIFAEERPCSHNSWDNVRSKAGVITLRCRECQEQFKGHPSLLVPCKEFQDAMSCSKENCTSLHVFKHKETLAERSKRFGDSVIKPDLPKKKKGARDGSTTPPSQGTRSPNALDLTASVTATASGTATAGLTEGSFASASSGSSALSSVHQLMVVDKEMEQADDYDDDDGGLMHIIQQAMLMSEEEGEDEDEKEKEKETQA